MKILIAAIAYFGCIACIGFGARGFILRERWWPFASGFLLCLVLFMVLIC